MSEQSIESLEEVRGIYPHPGERVLRKKQTQLDEHCRGLIALSPFVLMATASADGACDASPKGGPPGFVRVLDDHHLVVPDATGNRILDGLQNILENAHVGLLFLVPGMGETLRVNGRAHLTGDPELIADGATGGRPPALGVMVEVQEAYLHCAKALIRSSLWEPQSWPEADALPSAARIFSDHGRVGDVAAVEAAIAHSYATEL
jgi:PPOX class probable FMN-dependent enzyme